MTSSVIRRLERLENSGAHPLAGMAERLGAMRARLNAMSPEEYQRHQEEQRLDCERRLVARRAAHAIKPLRGLELRLLNAAERMRGYEEQEAALIAEGAQA